MAFGVYRMKRLVSRNTARRQQQKAVVLKLSQPRARRNSTSRDKLPSKTMSVFFAVVVIGVLTQRRGEFLPGVFLFSGGRIQFHEISECRMSVTNTTALFFAETRYQWRHAAAFIQLSVCPQLS